MNTKEAIKFLKATIEGYEFGKIYFEQHLEQTIDLLKRGEKFEQMWGELKEYPISHKYIEIPDKYRGYQGGALKYIVETIEQKYFPKPIRKTITFTIEEPTNDYLGEAINDFEMFWADYNEKKNHNIKYSYARK